MKTHAPQGLHPFPFEPSSRYGLLLPLQCFPLYTFRSPLIQIDDLLAFTMPRTKHFPVSPCWNYQKQTFGVDSKSVIKHFLLLLLFDFSIDTAVGNLFANFFIICSVYIQRHRNEHAYIWRYEGREVPEPSVLPSGGVAWCRVHREEGRFIQCRPSCHGGCVPGMACTSAHAYHGRAFWNSSLGTG